MAAPATQLVELTLRECLRALRSIPIGRLVYTEHALPAVRPVNFTVWDHAILIWSMPGTKAQILRNDVVAFEVDDINYRTGTGWSVVVLGKAEVITEPDELAELAAVTPPPTARYTDHVIRIQIEQVTGRRLAPDAVQPATQ